MAGDPGTTAPAVSAVVATHNRPELLRIAIDAILAQHYDGEIECIVVFDRTEPDAELEGLSRAGETPRRIVRVIRNERSPGLAGARNSGILAATGDLVAFCDDDDEWLPGKVTAQVATMSDPLTLTSVTGIRVAYDDTETKRVPAGDTLELAGLVRNRVMEAHPSSVMVRRSALLGEIGLVDEEIPGSYGEDFDWILRAAKAGRIAVVQADLVRVRWGQSLFSRNWQVIIDAIDYIVAKHDELRMDTGGLGRLIGRRSFAEAALGHRSAALRGAWRTIKLDWRQRRAYLAIAVALRLVSAERLMSVAHRRGRGI